MARQVALGLALLALVIPCTGCHTSNTRAPLTVSVRDKLTREPVPDAVVEMRTVHFYIPLEAVNFHIIDGSPPKSARGVTGADGAVRLDVIAQHPVQIIVIAAGYEPQCVELETHPALWTEQQRLDNADRWLDSDPGTTFGNAPRRVEVHLSGSSRRE